MRSVRLLTVAVLAVVLAMAMTGPAYATVTTITPSSADTDLNEDAPTTIYGTSTGLIVSTGLGMSSFRSLVRFVLSSIPSGSTINTASLQLYYYGTFVGGVDPVGRTYTANRVTTDWVEGTCDGCTPPAGNGATWNQPNAPTSSNWGTAGGDFTVTGAGSQTIPATFGYVTWDVTTVVKAWIEGGQPNYGFLMKDQNEGTGATGPGALFYAREHGYSTHMPILTVDYTAPPVGGVVMSANMLALVAPWLAVIGVVGCVTAVAVVAKKRRA